MLARAARAASPHSEDQAGALQTFRDERLRDATFATQWDAALESARAAVEHEIFRRAQEGWDEPVYGGRYRQEVVGSVRRYSDRLLELRAKALMPEYRDKPAPPAQGDLGPLDESTARSIGRSILLQAKEFAATALMLTTAPEVHHVQD